MKLHSSPPTALRTYVRVVCKNCGLRRKVGEICWFLKFVYFSNMDSIFKFQMGLSSIPHCLTPFFSRERGGGRNLHMFWTPEHTLKDMQYAIGAHSLLSLDSIFGTWTSRMSKGPDPDWILCSAWNGKTKILDEGTNLKVVSWMTKPINWHLTIENHYHSNTILNSLFS